VLTPKQKEVLLRVEDPSRDLAATVDFVTLQELVDLGLLYKPKNGPHDLTDKGKKECARLKGKP
jgi:hypothetical protein